MVGYKYDTEAEAQQAQLMCDQHYGIPQNEYSTTKHWVSYKKAEYDNPVFWYISAHDSLIEILGQPIEFNVQPFGEG